jgi:hypothetical protein
LALPGTQALTRNAPSDHVWHHGLWFSWKFINDVNYWEFNPKTGRPNGRTAWSNVEVETRNDHSAVISMKLSYQPATDNKAVLIERRRIEISPLNRNATYHIDWKSVFTATQEVTLDRTPPKDKSWGGYAGLSVRFAKGLAQRQSSNLAGPVAFDSGNRHRSRGGAMDYNGSIDGEPVGLAFLDDPNNPRHPTPWYLIRSPEMSYINGALLHDEPLVLESGEELTLCYRLVVHPGRWNARRLQKAYDEFTKRPDSSTND